MRYERRVGSGTRGGGKRTRRWASGVDRQSDSLPCADAVLATKLPGLPKSPCVFDCAKKKNFFPSFFLLFVTGNFLTFRGGCLPKKFGVACQKFQLLLMLFVSRVRDVTSMQTNLTTDLNREEPRTGGQDCVTIYCDTISGDNVDFLDGK